MKRPRRPAPPAIIDLEIEKLVYGGDGLARRDAVAYFVPFVLPQESIRARVTEKRKNFVRAEISEILRPSPDRVSPPCPHFGVCGGCHYQHIAYQRQLEAKREILRETLARIGHVNWTEPISLHASPPFGYRNRAQWKLRSLRPPRGSVETAPGAPEIGYFRAGSNRLCAVKECPVLSPALATAFAGLRGELAAGELPETIRQIEAFAAPNGDLLFNLTVTALPSSAHRTAERLRAAVSGLRSLLWQESGGERMHLDGPGFVSYRVAEREYRVGHMSFFQVNRFLIEEMISTIKRGPGGNLALDLYAGVGLFSAALSGKFARVSAVEADPAAARDLEANLTGTNAQTVNADAAKFLAERVARTDSPERPDLVLLDPPRSGLGPEALHPLARLKPKRTVYLSCDPATLARDLGELVAAGFHIAEIHLFDVFPQTFHIETLVELTTQP
jgi:23S rRNA (uracil1939-C5)-methyltransferase